MAGYFGGTVAVAVAVAVAAVAAAEPVAVVAVVVFAVVVAVVVAVAVAVPGVAAVAAAAVDAAAAVGGIGAAADKVAADVVGRMVVRWPVEIAVVALRGSVKFEVAAAAAATEAAAAGGSRCRIEVKTAGERVDSGTAAGAGDAAADAAEGAARDLAGGWRRCCSSSETLPHWTRFPGQAQRFVGIAACRHRAGQCRRAGCGRRWGFGEDKERQEACEAGMYVCT